MTTKRDFQKVLETLQVLDTDSINLYERFLAMSESALESETNNVSFMKEQQKLNKLFSDSLKIQEGNNKIIFDAIQKILNHLEVSEK
tara:strand:+ start:1436 stop:1696 length:261 start_codon:yes stop_codon:yes gene_type:complete